MSTSITNRLHHLVGKTINIVGVDSTATRKAGWRGIESSQKNSRPQLAPLHVREGMTFERLHREYEEQRAVSKKDAPESQPDMDLKRKPHDDHMTGMNTGEGLLYKKIARRMYRWIEKTLPAIFNPAPHGQKHHGAIPPAPGRQQDPPKVKPGKPEDPAHHLHGKKESPPPKSKPPEKVQLPALAPVRKRHDHGVEAGR